MATYQEKKLVTFEGDAIWGLQKSNGTANEKRGDYIRSTPKAVQKLGCTDTTGQVWTIDGYALAKKEDWIEYISQGFPIMTGFYSQRPMCDKYWNWIAPQGSKGGHAVCITGYDKLAAHFIANTSYGRYGVKGSGQFYIPFEDRYKLFSGFILFGLKKA